MAEPANIDKKKLLRLVRKKNSTIWAICEVLNVSAATLRKYLKKFNIKTKKGFYSKGLKVGRPKGIPMKEDQKKILSKKFKGKNNPFFGKKHTKKTKKQMSENHADFTGDKNPFKKWLNEDGNREIFSKIRKEVYKKKPQKQKDLEAKKRSLSMANSDLFAKNKFHKNHKSCHYESMWGPFFCRSSWEKEFLLFLEDNSSKIKNVQSENFTIKYINSNGEERHCRNDFFIEFKNKKKLIVEIKPTALLNYNENNNKIIAQQCFAKKMKYDFVLIEGKREIEDLDFAMEKWI